MSEIAGIECFVLSAVIMQLTMEVAKDIEAFALSSCLINNYESWRIDNDSP